MKERILEEFVELGKKYTTEELMIERITFAEIVWACCPPFLVLLPSLEFYKEQTGKKSLSEMEVQRLTVLNFVQTIAHFIGMTEKEAKDVFMAFVDLAKQDIREEMEKKERG